jgi:hypothetical protein
MTFPAHLSGMVDILVSSVNEIHEIDASLGDTRASGRQILNKLIDENKGVAAEARQTLFAWTLDTDPERKIIFAQVLRTEAYKAALAEVNAFIESNSPAADEQNLSDEQRAAKFAARSEAQKLASQMSKTLEMLLKDQPDLLAELPEVPAGLKGSFGKRGEMGRKIVGTFAYTINGEFVGNKSPAEAAKIAGVKTSELRLAVTQAYPGDTTPNMFKVTVGEATVEAVRDTDADDVDDADDDDETAESDATFE